MKPIRVSAHASEQMHRRGRIPAEVERAILDGEWTPARSGRLQCETDFDFGGDWNGRRYEKKRVRVIFAEEEGHLVVVTVYVYYF
jgi:hypothetical protein